MKYVIFMAVLFIAFTSTTLATGGKSNDNVPGKECEHGQHRYNPHCTPSGTPLPSATVLPTASVLPSTTPYATSTPSGSPTSTPILSPLPSPSNTDTPQRTPEGSGSASGLSGGDGKSDGRTDALGCQRPEDGCGLQPQVLGATLPETGNDQLIGLVLTCLAALALGSILRMFAKSIEHKADQLVEMNHYTNQKITEVAKNVDEQLTAKKLADKKQFNDSLNRFTARPAETMGGKKKTHTKHPTTKLGKKIKKVCKEMGINQARLGTAIKVSEIVISNWVKGRTRISHTNLKKLSDFTGKRKSYFMED